jgi:hypothetical protein
LTTVILQFNVYSGEGQVRSNITVTLDTYIRRETRIILSKMRRSSPAWLKVPDLISTVFHLDQDLGSCVYVPLCISAHFGDLSPASPCCSHTILSDIISSDIIILK